jgi:hypothetical protein
MKRLLVAAAGIVMLLAVFPATVDAGLLTAGNVSVVHGLGDVPGENPVDVYIRAAGSDDQFGLIIPGIDADFGYGAIVALGQQNAGDFDILLCAAVADPLQMIDDCADNESSAINGNSGNPVTIPVADQVVLFAGIGESTRPEVLVFVPDLACVDGSGNGRATAAHAADADPVTISVGGTPVIENLANGESQSLDVPAGSYDVNVSDGALLNLDTSLAVTALQNTMAYVTGDPDMQDQYTVITQTFAIEACPVQTTTTTAPPPRAAAQPRFTG